VDAMRVWIGWSAAALALFGAGIVQAAPAVEAFGALPAVSQPSLSPDGKHLAAIQPMGGRPGVLIWTMGAPKGTAPKSVGDSQGLITSIHWAGNERLLVTTNLNAHARGQHQMFAWYRTVSVDTDGNDAVPMFSDARWRSVNTSASEIVDLDSPDPLHIYMPLLEPEGVVARLQLFRVDVRTGSAELVQEGSMYTREWIMDGNGRLAGRLALTAQPLIDHLEVPDGKSWREIGHYDASGGQTAGIGGMAEDGVRFVRKVPDAAKGFAGLVTVDPANGTERALFSDAAYDVDSTLHDPWTGRVIGASFAADKREYRYFDPAMEGLQQGLEAAFPGLSVHAVSWNAAKTKLIVAAEGARKPLAYYLLDRVTHEASKIASAYPGIGDGDLGERKGYAYAARDGLNIPAYLTLPPGKPSRNLPAIVLPHGGPEERDLETFDWMAAFFASRGYAVLQPNFRGSSGYGKAFREAGYGQWGLKMQDDVTDGVKKMIADGIADPKRICIVGGSYGGYAALAGAAFTPDLYACAVSIAGVSDLRLFLKTHMSSHETWSGSAWDKFIGGWSDEKVDAISPARHADAVKCPVLLLHGVNDVTVPIAQSEAMRDALQKDGKSVKLVRLETDSHYLQLSETRIRFLDETAGFLKEHIGD
jgi:dipeptidyl aminopeptidase/acylaminoacyl peptidase